jgi:hypothetical protein
MSHRFLNFNKVERISREKEKSFPGPGLGSLSHEPTGALPEEDRWSGPMNDQSGGDSGTGPGHYVKDVSDLDKGTGTADDSEFRSVQNVIPPRAVPR